MQIKYTGDLLVRLDPLRFGASIKIARRTFQIVAANCSRAPAELSFPTLNALPQHSRSTDLPNALFP